MDTVEIQHQKELNRINSLVENAKTTGKPQLVNKWVFGSYSNLDNKYITSNEVIVIAMPDGALKTYDSNDENVVIPEYDGDKK